jgi:hypothetical protein
MNSQHRPLAALGVLLLLILCLLYGAQQPGQAPHAHVDGREYPTGYAAAPQETAAFVASLPAGERTFAEAGRRCYDGMTDDKPVLLYRALYAQHKAKYGREWTVGAQGIGDCVSWGWAHGAMIHHAVLCEEGEASDWDIVATEPIYGGSRVEAVGRDRGGWGDGSYGAAAAEWLLKWGVVYRQDYAGIVDLRAYSAQRAKQWGNYGCGGEGESGSKLDEIAKQHPCAKVALVTTFEEAAVAIANGYPVPVCSGQGFSSRRDELGFSRPSGSWSHCMCFVGVRHDRKGLLCLNSWGPDWVGGPKWPEDQPEGSFWVDERTAESMLRGRDSFAVAGLQGFVRRKIDHASWAQLPQKGSGPWIASH